jgi:hypothetical protein
MAKYVTSNSQKKETWTANKHDTMLDYIDYYSKLEIYRVKSGLVFTFARSVRLAKV